MRVVEKRLRQQVKDLQVIIKELEDDRSQFRSHFSIRFKYWIELLGNQKSPSPAWLIESDAKWLKSFKWWSW